MSFQERIIFFVDTITKGGNNIEETRKSIEKLGVQTKQATRFYDKATGKIIDKSDAIREMYAKNKNLSESLRELNTDSKRFREALSKSKVGFEKINMRVEAGTNKIMNADKVQERFTQTYNSFSKVMAMSNEEFKRFVGPKKNDFANWAIGTFGFKELANKMKGAKSKQKLKSILKNAE